MKNITPTFFTRKPFKIYISLVLVMFVFCNASKGQTTEKTETFYTSDSFTVPAGVTSIIVECWGAGGAGGGSTSNMKGGSGGGGGGYTTAILSVTPGQSIPYVVGVGGAGRISLKGDDGTGSSFKTFTASGGKGGKADKGDGGAGGIGENGIVNLAGIQGDKDKKEGGNGGDGANGGTGGLGHENANGHDGNIAGGGGGGGNASPGNNNDVAGGNGATGRVSVTYLKSITSIINTFTICTASKIQLENSTQGGTWTSATPTVATIDPTSGEVTGVSGGTTIITYSVPKSSFNGVSLGNLTRTETITVKPLPKITSLKTGTTCSGVAQNYNITSSESDATYSWSRAAVTGIVNPLISDQTTNPITETLINTTAETMYVKYLITPTANGCQGNQFIYNVMVYPTPDIKPIDVTICSGIEFTTSPLDGIIPSGTKYSWGIPSGSELTGGQTGTDAADIRGTLTNKTNKDQTAIYTVTPTSKYACNGSPFTVKVTVKPIVSIRNISLSVFSGVDFDYKPVNNTDGTVPDGTNYTWSAPTGKEFTGGASATGSYSFKGELKNTTNDPQIVIYTVTPSTENCSNNSTFTVTVTVKNNEWTGASNNNWSDASNWTQGEVLLDRGNLVFAENTFSDCRMDKDYFVKDIKINKPTHRLIANGSTLNVLGNLRLTDGGQINASEENSSVRFIGDVDQVIPSGAFYNDEVYDLSIYKNALLILNGTLKVLNTITHVSGKFDASTNSPTIIFAGSSIQSIAGDPYLNHEITNLTIDNSSGVMLNTDLVIGNKLTINSEKQLTISPNCELNVRRTIDNQAGINGLIIKADEKIANGSLIFHNTPESPVKATVEMYSKASKVDVNYKWQFFGIPIQSLVASPTLDGSYVREMHENDMPKHWDQLKNTSLMSAFKGYEITQTSPRTIYFQGDLVNENWSSDPLSYTVKTTTPFITYPGQHLIGNPYTAAISISKIEFDPGILNTVYLYNTGSYDDWSNKSADSTITSGTNYTAGQYIAVPKSQAGVAGLQSQIPSMQAFLVRTKVDGAKIKIPYNSTGVMIKNTTTQRIQTSPKIYTIIKVKGKRYSDCMWIFSDPNCSHNFDNGWDGEKIMGSPLAPQLFAMENDGDYQVNSVDDINNTYLGFQAGEDSENTLTFTHKNIESRYEGLYLVDLMENKTIDITQSGTEYIFSAGLSKTPTKRFRIITNPVIKDTTYMATGLSIFSSQGTVFLHNRTNENGYILLYDMTGRMLQKLDFDASGITSFPLSLTPGTYIVKALTNKEEITKRLVLPQTEK